MRIKEEISSRDNKKIKYVKKLLDSASFRKEENYFVAEGLRLCSDAVKNLYSISEMYITAEFAEKFSEEVEIMSRSANACYIVSKSVLAKISDTVSPQGIVCVFCRSNIIKDKNNICKNGRYIVLDNVQDPSNLGAIARCAEAMGVDGLITANGCDPFSPKAQRAAMGALIRLPVFIFDNSISAVELLKSKEIKVYASVVSNADCNVNDITFANGCAVVIGNEANGVSAEVQKLSDKRITIPMKGKAESLNAASAASVLIWEMTK